MGKKRSFKWDNVRICLVTLGFVWEKKGNAWEHIDIYGKIVWFMGAYTISGFYHKYENMIKHVFNVVNDVKNIGNFTFINIIRCLLVHVLQLLRYFSPTHRQETDWRVAPAVEFSGFQRSFTGALLLHSAWLIYDLCIALFWMVKWQYLFFSVFLFVLFCRANMLFNTYY